MKSHYKKKAAGAILLIWQREPGPDVFTDTFAKRHMEFLRGRALFSIRAQQTTPVLKIVLFEHNAARSFMDSLCLQHIQSFLSGPLQREFSESGSISVALAPSHCHCHPAPETRDCKPLRPQSGTQTASKMNRLKSLFLIQKCESRFTRAHLSAPKSLLGYNTGGLVSPDTNGTPGCPQQSQHPGGTWISVAPGLSLPLESGCQRIHRKAGADFKLQNELGGRKFWQSNREGRRGRNGQRETSVPTRRCIPSSARTEGGASLRRIWRSRRGRERGSEGLQTGEKSKSCGKCLEEKRRSFRHVSGRETQDRDSLAQCECNVNRRQNPLVFFLQSS